MQFNEFQRRLEKCDLNVEARFLLSHMFEVQVEFSRSLDISLGLMERLVNTVQDVNNINGNLIREIKTLRQGTPGIEVHSVRNDPDDV